MSAMPHFVAGSDVPGRMLLFCNGIENTFSDAEKSAQMISKIFEGERVYIFHNPTRAIDYYNPEYARPAEAAEKSYIGKAVSYVANTIGKHQKTEPEIVLELVDKIRLLLAKGLEHRECKLCIFAHSHGARVVRQALEQVLDWKEFLEIHAFGGATIIPNELARKVHNYIFDIDWVSAGGNITDHKEHNEPGLVSGILATTMIMRQQGNARLTRTIQGSLHTYDITIAKSSPASQPLDDGTAPAPQHFMARVLSVGAACVSVLANGLHHHNFLSYEVEIRRAADTIQHG